MDPTIATICPNGYDHSCMSNNCYEYLYKMKDLIPTLALSTYCFQTPHTYMVDYT